MFYLEVFGTFYSYTDCLCTNLGKIIWRTQVITLGFGLKISSIYDRLPVQFCH